MQKCLPTAQWWSVLSWPNIHPINHKSYYENVERLILVGNITKDWNESTTTIRFWLGKWWISADYIAIVINKIIASIFFLHQKIHNTIKMLYTGPDNHDIFKCTKCDCTHRTRYRWWKEILCLRLLNLSIITGSITNPPPNHHHHHGGRNKYQHTKYQSEFCTGHIHHHDHHHELPKIILSQHIPTTACGTGEKMSVWWDFCTCKFLPYILYRCWFLHQSRQLNDFGQIVANLATKGGYLELKHGLYLVYRANLNFQSYTPISSPNPILTSIGGPVKPQCWWKCTIHLFIIVSKIDTFGFLGINIQ